MSAFSESKQNKSLLFIILVSFFCALIFSLIAGLRDGSVGTDTETYIDIFSSIMSGGGEKYEPGFVAFVRLLGTLFLEPAFIFFCLAFFITIFYYAAFWQFFTMGFQVSEAKTAFFVFTSLMLLSSWYLVAVTNGIRQGASLVIVYFSLALMFKRKYFKFFVFFLLAVSFHYSSLLVLPCLILALFSHSVVTLVWIFSAFGYVFGVNEVAVSIFSELTGIPIYSLVKEYAEGAGKWVGFSWPFFLYTFLWGLVSGIVNAFRLVSSDRTRILRNVDLAYKVLSIPYFTLGFGAYSNRYAFICWLFLPILQSILIMSVRISRCYLFFAFFLVSFGSFLFFVLKIYSFC